MREDSNIVHEGDMAHEEKTIDKISVLLCKACRDVVSSCTGIPVSYAETLQIIPKVGLSPDLGCFVTIGGDYRGLVVLNFTSRSAMRIYSNYMTTMGISESDLASDYTSIQVADAIGEVSNQITGAFLRQTQEVYQLAANCGQPKALAINSQISLIIESTCSEHRRMSFCIGNDRFSIELALEQTEFIKLPCLPC